MTKRIIITGTAGFIGFHLAQQLAARGDYVVGYDNFNDYYTPALKKERAEILKDKGIEVVEGDICDRSSLEELVVSHGVTHLVNLAAQAGVRYSLSDPDAYIKTNIDGFLQVLEVCRSHPHLKLTYASSSSVYGRNEKTPFSETDRVDNQASLYGVTKKANELMASTYHHLYGISVTGLRFFTVYGPWGRPDMAYYSFAKKIMKGEPIEVFNQGKMARDFTYIDDIVAGTISAIDLGAPCELFNLGNHKPESLLDFISLLEKALGKEAKKILRPMQPGDVVATCADISHSQERLGYSPQIPLVEGIPRFVEWFSFQNIKEEAKL